MEQITHSTKRIILFVFLIGISINAVAQENISLMVYATPAAIAGLNGSQNAKATIRASVNNFNDAIALGGIIDEVEITAFLDVGDEANMCKRTLLNELTSSSDMPQINADREKFRGDVVLLVIDDDQSCGISGYSNSKFASFIVIHYACLGANYSLPRQLGYILEAGNENSQSGIFSFFAPNGRAHTALNDDGDAVFTTIMGYTDETNSSGEDDFIMIPYFSDPNVDYQGKTTGAADENNIGAIKNHWKYVSAYMDNFDSYVIYESSLEDDEELDLYCNETLLVEDFEAESGSQSVFDAERLVFSNGVKFVRGSNAYKRRRIQGGDGDQ